MYTTIWSKHGSYVGSVRQSWDRILYSAKARIFLKKVLASSKRAWPKQKCLAQSTPAEFCWSQAHILEHGLEVALENS